MNKNMLIFCILFIVAFAMIGSGCLSEEEELTFIYMGEIGYMGDTQNATSSESLQPNLYYPIITDEDFLFFVDIEGKMFVIKNEDFDTSPIRLTRYQEGNLFLWDRFFEHRANDFQDYR
jgi:hypothetical protein